MKNYWLYIITNSLETVLYTGVTNNLERRLYEHRHKLVKGFLSKYNLIKLVFFQKFSIAEKAIAAEKKIKGWTRAKKLRLIESINPYWKELDGNY